MATLLRSKGDAQLAAQRDVCDYAGRPALEGRARAEQLYHLMDAAKRDGNLDRARVYAMELRPIMHLLPEGK